MREIANNVREAVPRARSPRWQVGRPRRVAARGASGPRLALPGPRRAGGSEAGVRPRPRKQRDPPGGSCDSAAARRGPGTLAGYLAEFGDRGPCSGPRTWPPASGRGVRVRPRSPSSADRESTRRSLGRSSPGSDKRGYVNYDLGGRGRRRELGVDQGSARPHRRHSVQPQGVGRRATRGGAPCSIPAGRTCGRADSARP